MTSQGGGRREGRAQRLLAMLLELVVVSVLAVAVTAALDREQVTSADAQADLSFGLPVPWMHQDRSASPFDLPGQVPPGAPWETPTTIDGAALAADVAFFLVVLLLAWLGGRALLQRLPGLRNSPPPEPPYQRV